MNQQQQLASAQPSLVEETTNWTTKNGQIVAREPLSSSRRRRSNIGSLTVTGSLYVGMLYVFLLHRYTGPIAAAVANRMPTTATAFHSLSWKVQQQQQKMHHTQQSKHHIYPMMGQPLFFHQQQRSSPACSARLEMMTTHTLEGEENDGTSVSSSDSASAYLLDGLNDAQVQAVTQPLSSITRVVAGPGAGKTRVLTCRMAHLLQQDSDKRVLAVTFTKKASGEMQQRLKKLVEQQVIEEPHQQQPLFEQEDHTDGTGEIVQEEVGGGASQEQGRYMDRATLGTFHSICAKILRWNGRLLGSLPSVKDAMMMNVNGTSLDGTFVIIDQNEQMRVMKECFKDMNIELKDKDNKELKPLTILNAIGQLKSKEIMGESDKDPKQKMGAKTKRIATEVYPRYREKLLANNALDFDDLIFLSRELLMHDGTVREKLQQRWTHILVDEFQDTSRAQLDLVKLLSSNSLFIVGDADQSIYSWRGAHVESMSDFENEFKQKHSGGVQTVYLMENYRSTTNIVNAAQKVISSSPSSTASPQDELRKDMKPMRGTGPTPRVLACADGKAEASFVVKTILEKTERGEFSNEDTTVAIIYRTNAQSRTLEEACVQNNLPYVMRGSAGAFYNRLEIKDCLCFLRWLYNGRDQAAIMRAVKTPSRGIGNKALEEFFQYCAQVDAFYESNQPNYQPRPTPLDILISFTDNSNGSSQSADFDIPSPTGLISNRAMNRFLPFSEQMRFIRDKAYSQTVADLLSSIITNLELRTHFDAISKTNEEFADRWSNVMELRKAAERYSEDGPCLKRVSITDTEEEQGGQEGEDSPLSKFLDDVALVTDIQPDDTEQAGSGRLVAELMTIHASKGMEFDAVFLVGNEDGTFPTKQAIVEGEGSIPLDEEKRLCYVAMTRAKTHLVLTWRREVQIFAGQGFQKIDAERSRFLDVLVAKKKVKIDGQKASTKQTKSFTRSETPSKSAGAPRRQMSAATNRVKREPSRQQEEMFRDFPSRKRAVVNRSVPGLKDIPSRKRASVKQQRVPELTDKVRTGTQSVARQSPIRKPLRENSKGLPKPARRRDSPAATGTKQRNMDSTWFFPIGSKVAHGSLGVGIVLPPPPTDESGILLVRVKFGNGEKLEFPADGPDIQAQF